MVCLAVFVRIICDRFSGDMTKAIGNPLELNDQDLGHIGLDAPPRVPLPGRNPGPSRPDQAGGKGQLAFYYCIYYYIIFLFSKHFLRIAGSSNDTISGWVECLEAIYKDIGGCFLLFCFLFLVLLFLCFVYC